jgi:hypothetical protein
MKKIAYILNMVLVMIFLSTGMVYSQNIRISRKERRKLEHLRKKKNHKKDLLLSKQYYYNLLKKKYFVFTADFAVNDEGVSFVTNPQINFVSVIGDSITFQFGRDGRIGWNGVGGITAHGTVNDYKFNPGNKKGGMIVTSSAIMNGPTLTPSFTLYVSDDGTAQLVLQTGNGEILTLTGRIYSPQNSGVFEGESMF